MVDMMTDDIIQNIHDDAYIDDEYDAVMKLPI